MPVLQYIFHFREECQGESEKRHSGCYMPNMRQAEEIQGGERIAGAKENQYIHKLKATVWIGKKGATESILDEIEQQLNANGVVKIKWLKNAEIDPEYISALLKAELLDARGRTMVLRRLKPGR